MTYKDKGSCESSSPRAVSDRWVCHGTLLPMSAKRALYSLKKEPYIPQSMSPMFPHLPVSGTRAVYSLKKDPCIPQAMSPIFPHAKEPRISAMNALRFRKNAESPGVGSESCVWCLSSLLCLMSVIAGCECYKSPIFPQERALYSPKEELYIPPRKSLILPKERVLHPPRIAL